MSTDVNLDALPTELDGYSATHCVALLPKAALTAMRRSIDAADVTAEDVAKPTKSSGSQRILLRSSRCVRS